VVRKCVPTRVERTYAKSAITGHLCGYLLTISHEPYYEGAVDSGIIHGLLNAAYQWLLALK
jgi:hypothetical protein